MPIVLSYVTTLAVFLVIDGLWLGTMADRVYRPLIGDILVEGFRIGPAVAFYLVYAAGLAIFAVVPALKLADWTHAALWGALFGFFAYATYDLTNYATLRGWGLTITVVDLTWGTIASGLGAAVAYWAVSALQRAFGWVM